MAHSSTPHFHNTDGLRSIEVGSKEFQCVGALPPFDHPHIYLDMGKDTEIVCPYCSTLYIFNGALGEGQANPASALLEGIAAA
ncbi:zinc-finger domain-containing protein [Devosia sp. PTR5]|uniref:Zinc-finger domain-containing protein n=1 Tax=Devosia oryzisoli TaxID=2774138 RepID=A0A927FUL6_9HYPH|nr:zinc-finger domain-containing protein [Devosia oryzisoli]MBD8064371.1 zinc-finger domain-containing protein [Devosia oryzisoli]